MESLSLADPRDRALDAMLRAVGEMDRYFPQKDRLAGLAEEILQAADCDALDDEQLEAVAGGVHYVYPFEELR